MAKANEDFSSQGGDCTKYACTALTLTKKGTKPRLVVPVRNRPPGTPQGGCPERHYRSVFGLQKNTRKNLSGDLKSDTSCLYACRLGCHAEGKEDAARGTEAQHVVRRCTTHAQDGSSYAFGYSSRCVPRQKGTKGDGAEDDQRRRQKEMERSCCCIGDKIPFSDHFSVQKGT